MIRSDAPRPYRLQSAPSFEPVRQAVRAGFPAAAALTLAALINATPANAQTVSCATAQTPAEFAICNSETLQVLDEKMDEALKSAENALADKASRQQLTRRQSAWKVEREACKTDFNCLEARYESRLGELDGEPSAKAPILSFKRFAAGS